MTKVEKRKPESRAGLGSFPRIAIVGGSLLLVAAGILITYWQPERQVQVHTDQLLNALANRNWEQVDRLIADDYADAWGFTKETAVTYSRQVFQPFLSLSFEPRTIEVSLEDQDQGKALTSFQVEGRPLSPVSNVAQSELNALETPFEFHWVKQSWKPFDWQLVKLENRALDLSEAAAGFQ